MVNFEFGIFTSIIILSFLLFLKLTGYLADFKNVKNQSRIEIVFLTIFFVFLFVPMSHISKDETSKTENRTLAKKPIFIEKSGEINYKYGKDFDSWFNDRFNLRTFLLKFEPIILSKINFNRVIFGSDGWLFLKYDNVYDDYANRKNFSEREMKEFVENFKEIDNYCKKHNKQFILLIAPTKHRIYGEYFPNYINKTIPDKYNNANIFIEYLQKNSNVKVFAPYKELEQKKKEGLLYYKTDSHWNTQAAYIVFEQLMKNLGAKNNINIKIAEISPKVRDLDRVYNNKINDKTIYKEVIFEKHYREIPFEDKYSTIPSSDNRHDRITLNEFAKNNETLVIYRDSFSNDLLPFLSESFEKVISLRRRNFERKYIDKGDIIIYEFVERALPTLTKKEIFDWKNKR